MSAPEIWLTILLLTAVTVITRNFFLVAGEAVRLPPRVQQALRYAPACALAALVAPELLLDGSRLALQAGNHRLLAAGAALAVMLTTRNMLATMAAGMGAFLALRHAFA